MTPSQGLSAPSLTKIELYKSDTLLHCQCSQHIFQGQSKNTSSNWYFMILLRFVASCLGSQKTFGFMWERACLDDPPFPLSFYW